jgi:hypothetical protein
LSWAYQHTPIAPALRRLRQEEGKFKASLGYKGNKLYLEILFKILQEKLYHGCPGSNLVYL